MTYNFLMNINYLEQQLKELDAQIEENRKLVSDPELAPLAKLEIEQLEQQKKELEQSAATPMSEQGTVDSEKFEEEVNPNVAILEVRAAAGGDEAGLFATELLRMYLR